MKTVEMDYIARHFSRLQQTLESARARLTHDIGAFSELVTQCFRSGHKILVMGNGGSAGDAQHFAAELVGRFLRERKALPAIALNTNTSTLTAVANDYHFDEIFSRQVEALAVPGDVLVGISTSGNSPNVLKAMKTGRDLGCRTVALTGRGGGEMVSLSDLSLVVLADETPHVQEAHIAIIHIVCGLVEDRLFA
jgi:D-sedoheptulose 7-phosphate isomerase